MICELDEMVPVAPRGQWGLGRAVIPNHDRYPATIPFHPFDYVVTEDMVIEEYVLVPGGLLNCYRVTVIDLNAVSMELIGSWQVGTIGSFHVVADKDRRYLVARSGRLLLLDRPQNADGPSVVKELWKGPPPSALICDTGTGRHYVFTDRRFFEVTDPVVEFPHAIPVSNELLSSADSLSVVLDCFKAVDQKRQNR
jgi:hypothetical protein